VPAVARSLMPGCVAYCSENWPNISLGIDDCAAADVVRKASRGEVEFGIASGEITNAELHIEPLMEDPFRLVCRRDDAIAASGTATWAQLSGRRLVMLDNTSGSRQVIEATLTRTRTKVDIFLELAQPSSVLGMVEAGIGIAVLPQLAAPRHDDGLLAICRLTEPSVSRTILLLRRRDRSLSPAAAAVWTALRELHGHAREDKSKPVARAPKRQARSSRHKKPRA
jgi:DNA-binding transcriptional LysR family regulator